MFYIQGRRGRFALYGLVSLVLISMLAATGCGKGTRKNIKIDGVVGPTVNFIDNKLTMAVVLKNVQLDVGARVAIPKLPNSYLEIGPDFQTNGLLVFIGVDATDIKALVGDAFNVLDPLTLPGGRPLPGIAEGWLPGLAIEVPKLHNVIIYAGTALLGVFIPAPLPWKDYIGTFRFYDGAGDRIGNISIVGKDSSDQNSGILLLVNLSGKVGNLVGL